MRERPIKDETKGARGRKSSSAGVSRMKGTPKSPGRQRPESPMDRAERLRRIARGMGR